MKLSLQIIVLFLAIWSFSQEQQQQNELPRRLNPRSLPLKGHSVFIPIASISFGTIEFTSYERNGNRVVILKRINEDNVIGRMMLADGLSIESMAVSGDGGFAAIHTCKVRDDGYDSDAVALFALNPINKAQNHEPIYTFNETDFKAHGLNSKTTFVARVIASGQRGIRIDFIIDSKTEKGKSLSVILSGSDEESRRLAWKELADAVRK